MYSVESKPGSIFKKSMLFKILTELKKKQSYDHVNNLTKIRHHDFKNSQKNRNRGRGNLCNLIKSTY